MKVLLRYYTGSTTQHNRQGTIGPIALIVLADAMGCDRYQASKIADRILAGHPTEVMIYPELESQLSQHFNLARVRSNVSLDDFIDALRSYPARMTVQDLITVLEQATQHGTEDTK